MPDERHTRSTALLLLLVLAGACSRSSVATAAGTGVARLLVACGDATSCTPIASVVVTVTAGDGPDFPAIVERLARSGDQWSGRIENVPAGPGRRFDVQALDAAGAVLYTGSGRADIAPGAAAVVSVFLNGTGGPVPVLGFPVIDSLAMSRTEVAPGRSMRLSVTAHDASTTGPLTFWWRASCGSYDDAARSAPTWTAPGAEGVCQLSVSVANERGAAVTASLSVTVTTQVGDVSIVASVNGAPIVSGLTGRVTLGPVMQGDLFASASDPDGDPLTFAWSSNCAGLAFDLHPPYGPPTPHLSMPGPSEPCTVTLTVTDGPTRGGRTTASIVLPPNVALSGPCTGVTCQAGQTCDPVDGRCKAPANACGGVTCTAPDLCHDPGTCDQATAACSAPVARTCPPGQSCDLADGACKPAATSVPLPRPLVARSLDLPALQGVALATDGSAYVTGTLTLPAKTFDAFLLTSAGGADAFVARYGADGTAVWARAFGDASDQQPTGVAVTADGTVVSIGQFTGTLAPGATNARATPIDYLLGLRAADGAVRFARAFDNGVSGVLVAIASNPALDRVAVCGYTDRAATDLVPGATFGGGKQDVVVAAFDSAGTRLWSRQFGGANEEECDALAVDDAGDVYAAGRYDGSLSFTGAALPNPGSSFRRWIWVAKLDGATGTPLAQASFGAGAGSHKPLALAVDGTGKLLVAGLMSNTLNFGSTPSTLLTSAGGTDAFVAKLDPSAATPFARIWSTRLGGTGPDEARGVAVDSRGNATVVGLFSGTTTGAASLTAANVSGSSAFVLELDGSTGDALFPSPGGLAWGDAAHAVAAGRVAIAARGTGDAKDRFVLGGEFQGSIDAGSPTTRLVAPDPSVFLVFGRLLP